MYSKFLKSDIESISSYLTKYKRKVQGKTFLITGGSGFIGSYLVESLVNFNKNTNVEIKIISVDNNITSVKRYGSGSGIVYLRKDVSKHFNLKGHIDYIIHAAGIASPVYYQKYPLETIDIAVSGTRNMLDLAKSKKVKSVLFFSSSEIYGNPPKDKIPTSEDYNGNVSSIGPRSCYDESKRLGETLCMTYFRLFKTPVKVVRPFNVFGPGMSYRDYRVIPTFIYRGIKDKKIKIHSNGKQTRTFCYITDAVCSVFDVLLSNDNGEVYNIGNDASEINMNNLAVKVAKYLGNKSRLSNVKYPLKYPLDEPSRRSPDLRKLKDRFGYNPMVSTDDGLKKMIAWCRENWQFSELV